MMNKALILKSLMVCGFFICFQLVYAGTHRASFLKTSQGVLEVVMFTAKPAYSAQEISRRADAVTRILRSYSGFISRSLSESTKEKNQWIDIVHWRSLDDALVAADKVVTTSRMKKFMSVMQRYDMYHFNVRFDTTRLCCRLTN